MTPLHSLISVRPSLRGCLAAVCLFAFAGCATTPPVSSPVAAEITAAKELRLARGKRHSLEERAASYLAAAADAAPLLDQPAHQNKARAIYNAAASELTLLLRSADGGRLWNRPVTLTADGVEYRLRFAPASKQNDTWDPGYFEFFRTPQQVKEKSLVVQDQKPGAGGVLVGVHQPPDPRAVFLYDVGVAAPVTAILDFQKNAGAKPVRDVTLALYDPTRRDSVRIDGTATPLAADFTAPIAYYPNPPFQGLLEAMRVDRYFDSAGLFMLQPYDPDRIPVIFVHGLASAPGMWLDTIDAVEADPEMRGRFQFWVFGYPTGDPISISALQFRESLASVYQLYPRTKDMVLVSHSLGGLLSQMQSVDIGRTAWDATFEEDADRLFAKVPADNQMKRALLFEANPRIKRIVFICVPHRGSPLADNTIGAVGLSLIHLPAQVVDNVQKQVGHSLAVAAGKKGFIFPPSVHGLSPNSPLLHALDQHPIQAAHHTVAGDRGKGNSPKSSDGVVPYGSSHLASAQSELIVPGPHGSYKLPETVAELSRILRLHLHSATR